MNTNLCRVLCVLFLGLLPSLASVQAAAPPPADIPKPVLLWPAGAPNATGDTDEDKPAIYPFPAPPDHNTGAAILVCPGGGFTTRCTDFEGVLVARELNARGIGAFVLRYRIRPIYTMKESLADAARGMQFLRAHAGEFHLAPDRLGVIGFSAGAELAAAASLRPVPAKADAADPLEKLSSRPDFLVLAYGSSSPNTAGESLASAPPTFMFCTAEDTSHLTGMISLYSALRRARVPAEAHFFAAGEHGVGVAQGDPVLGQWPDLMHRWMRASGFLTAARRVALRGLVTLDGEPLPRGYVILTPLDETAGIPVVARVFNTGPTRGEFAVPQSQGPTPGRYRVELRQDATRWLSNSRDPLQLRMNQKARAGALTDDDRKEWIAYTRARDLSPSIEGQRVFRHAKPTDAGDWVIEIKAGEENRIDLQVSSK